MGKWKGILSIGLIYCGTVFGAGFASGQEVVRFFSRFFFRGSISGVIVGFLFSFFGYVICYTAKKKNMKNSKAYFQFLLPKPIAAAIHSISVAFLGVSFCIMISAAGTLLFEQFQLPCLLGGGMTLVLCMVFCKKQVLGLARLNVLLTPALFLGVVGVCCALLQQIIPQAPQWNGAQARVTEAAFLFGFLYLSFNLLSAAAVLVPSAHLAKSPVTAGLGGALGGILVALPLVLMIAVLAQSPHLFSQELPFFALIRTQFPAFSYFGGFLLYGAMLTTAVSSGVSVLTAVSPKQRPVWERVLFITGLIASVLPFGILVKTLYSAFGVCAGVFVMGLIKSLFRK